MKKYLLENGKKQVKRIHHDKILDSNSKYNKWINLFETMLSITEWLTCSNSLINLSDLRPIKKTRLNEITGFEELQNNVVNGNQDFKESKTSLHNVSSDTLRSLYSDSSDLSVASSNYNHDDEYNDSYVDIAIFKKEKSISIDNDPTYFGSNAHLKVETNEILISNAEYGLRVFFKMINLLLNYRENKQLMNGRLHQLLHYPRYILEFGSPCNFNGSIPESLNKELAKKVGKRTHQRWKTLHCQAAERFFENTITRLSMNLAIDKGFIPKQTNCSIKKNNEWLTSGCYTFTVRLNDKIWKKKTRSNSRKTYDKYVTSMLNELNITECEVGKETHSKSKKLSLYAETINLVND